MATFAVATETALEEASAVLTVDLGAIVENYQLLSRTAGSAECAAVVKADAYGLGAHFVVPALVQAGCSSFFVAHLDEALAMRRHLRRGSRIYVLNGFPKGAQRDAAVEGVVPVINSLEQLSAWRRDAARVGDRLLAAVQIDTGMARLGLSQQDAKRIANDPALLEGIDLVLVMSHLACADVPTHPANDAQLRRFAEARRLFPGVPASLANSSGLFLGLDYAHDLIRPGAALYGINPVPGRSNPMRQVLRLSARLLQTHEIGQGTGIGYGHDFISRRPMRLATISLGYADGWHRRYGGTAAFWNGVRLPIVGRMELWRKLGDDGLREAAYRGG